MSLTKAIQKAIEKNIDKFVDEIENKFGVSKTDLMDLWMDISKMKSKNKNKNKKLSPWLQFCKDQRIIIKKNSPETSFGEISKMIGVKWSQMTKEEKKNYNKIVEKEEEIVVEDTLKDETVIEETLKDEEDETIIVEETLKEETMIVEETLKEDEEETMILKDDEIIKNETMIVIEEDETLKEDEEMMSSISEKLKEYNEKDLKKMKTSELKDMCQHLLLSKTGKKGDLVDRLINYKNTSHPSYSDNEESNSDDE